MPTKELKSIKLFKKNKTNTITLKIKKKLDYKIIGPLAKPT